MDKKFERIVEFEPAYDGRPASRGGRKEWRTKTMLPDDGTDKPNYGVEAVRIRFLLRGKRGVVQFLISTNWYPPHVQEEQKYAWHRDSLREVEPEGWDVGYHSLTPMYEGQERGSESCEYLDGKPCYYDGSSLRADEWVRDILLKEGSDGVWRAMEDEYEALFGEPHS